MKGNNMTSEQLDKANKLSREIQELSRLVGNLSLTIEMQEENYCFGKPARILKSFLRFLNGQKKKEGPEEAQILLFRGLEGHPALDIPVDVKVLEILHAHFSERLKEMEAEFADLGKEG